MDRPRVRRSLATTLPAHGEGSRAGVGQRSRRLVQKITVVRAAFVDGGMCPFAGMSDFFTERKLMLFSRLLGIPELKRAPAAKELRQKCR